MRLFHHFLSRSQQTATLLLLATLMAGCAQQLGGGPVEAPESWRSHRQQLEALDHWQLRGRLNIRGEDTSRTLNLLWVQSGASFDINLSGSLGFGSVRVQGDASGLVLSQSGEDPIHMDSLADLSEALLGYAFPADNLRYWVRGVMAPDSPWQADWNEYQLLSHLDQNRWQVVFDRYSAVDSLNLPGRIRLSRPPWRLTFLISDWRLETAP